VKVGKPATVRFSVGGGGKGNFRPFSEKGGGVIMKLARARVGEGKKGSPPRRNPGAIIFGLFAALLCEEERGTNKGSTKKGLYYISEWKGFTTGKKVNDIYSKIKTRCPPFVFNRHDPIERRGPKTVSYFSKIRSILFFF